MPYGTIVLLKLWSALISAATVIAHRALKGGRLGGYDQRRMDMQVRSLKLMGLIAGAVLLAPVTAHAQDSEEEQVARRALNEEQARFAAQQISELEAQKQAIAQEQEAKERAYREALAARDAEIAATNAAAAEARLRWEAAVTACLAGDRSQCAQPDAVAQ
jgi:hypothetical protein